MVLVNGYIGIIRPARRNMLKDDDSTLVCMVNPQHRSMLEAIYKPKADGTFPGGLKLIHLSDVILKTKLPAYQIESTLRSGALYMGKVEGTFLEKGAVRWSVYKNRYAIHDEYFYTINPDLLDDKSREQLMIAKLKDQLIEPFKITEIHDEFSLSVPLY